LFSIIVAAAAIAVFIVSIHYVAEISSHFMPFTQSAHDIVHLEIGRTCHMRKFCVSIYLVVHGTSGSTSYETIPHVRMETSGGMLSTVDMVVQ